MKDSAMPSAQSAGDAKRRIRQWHVLPAVLLALTAYLSAQSGLDQVLAGWFYDPVSRSFPARAIVWLEQLGHRGAKSAVLIIFLALLVAALSASRIRALTAHRKLLWVTALAMALGPTLVGLLKLLTTPSCPWDLVEFGGHAIAPQRFWAIDAPAGHCFPSGHASGGFALVALYLAGEVSGLTSLRRWGLLLALSVGGLFSAIRIVQGAHFLSHNLWAAAIDWTAALLVFSLARISTENPITPHHDAAT